MGVYIKNITKDDLAENGALMWGKRIIFIPPEDIKAELEEAPSIDVVPVVRCKDCKHNYSKKHNKRYNHEDIVCDYFETDGLNDDDFCSYGERSEE